MRIVLHTGKGGVGKTTVSAMTALAAARNGGRTLLLSTDAAHSVADVLGVPVSGEPTEVAQNLWAAQVDIRRRFEQGWSAIREYLVDMLAARGIAEVQAEELTVLPGADEIVTLLELRRWADSGLFDVIVVDCAPTGETLRLLALPETVAFYATKLMGHPQRLLRSLAATLTRQPDRNQVPDALVGLLEELTAARALLADPSVSGIRLVVTGERVVIAEARRLLTALYLYGYPVEAVVVNRLLPDGVGGDFLSARRSAEAQALAAIRESFGGLDLHLVPMTATEPVGADALAELAGTVFGDSDPMVVTHRPPALDVAGQAGLYTLRLPLPLVQRDTVDLTRSGDELVVTVGEHRRRIALPSLLQRCRTTGARFDDDVLVIDFEPDLDRWPAGLAAGVDQARAAAAR